MILATLADWTTVPSMSDEVHPVDPSVPAKAVPQRTGPRSLLRKPFSFGYRPYERQGPGHSINAVDRDVVRAGIRHIAELSGRMDGDRGIPKHLPSRLWD